MRTLFCRELVTSYPTRSGCQVVQFRPGVRVDVYLFACEKLTLGTIFDDGESQSRNAVFIGCALQKRIFMHTTPQRANVLAATLSQLDRAANVALA